MRQRLGLFIAAGSGPHYAGNLKTKATRLLFFLLPTE
jgi:hypothetical protein